MRKIFTNFNIPTIKRALALMERSKNTFIAFILGFCAVELCCSVLYTAGIKGAVNAILEMNFSAFWLPMGFIIANHLLWWIYAPISAYITERISKRTIQRFKSDLCGHIIRLPMGYHDNKPTGELLSALSNDTACLSGVYDWSFFQVLRSAIGGIGGIIIMAVIDWRFGIVVLSLGIISVFLSSQFSKRLEVIGNSQQQQLAKTSTDVYELVRAAKTIRLFHLEADRQNKFANIAHEEAKIKVEWGNIGAKMKSVISLVNMLTYIVVLFAGAFFVHYNLSDWGTVIALLGLKGTADMLFVECGQFMAEMQTNVAGIKRVLELVDTDEEGEIYPGIYPQPCDTDVLKMENINFAYERNKPVLQNFNLYLKQNTLTALIGESGSGKSTVMKLILGLYKPDSGVISAEKAGNLRRMTAYVPQEPILFRGTVYENIAFGNPEVGEEEIFAAAEAAGADEFIKSLENGYQTMLLDDGKGLSGGQKQRIALARALVKNAPILLLDEITSALDSEAELSVLNTIRKIADKKTVLLVTHNKNAVKNAVQIVTLPKMNGYSSVT